MPERVIEVLSSDLERGYQFVAAEDEPTDLPNGKLRIRGSEIYRADDESIAHDLFSVGRVMAIEKKYGTIKTMFILVSRFLAGLRGDDDQG